METAKAYVVERKGAWQALTGDALEEELRCGDAQELTSGDSELKR